MALPHALVIKASLSYQPTGYDGIEPSLRLLTGTRDYHYTNNPNEGSRIRTYESQGF